MNTFSKKIMSLLLAAVMIIASVPMSAMTAFAGDLDGLDATDENLINVTEAMDAYRLAMDGTVYNGMADAYNKYVAAQETIDAYKYGNGNVEAMDAAANALNTATNAMKANKWTAKTTNVNAAADNSYSTSTLTGGDTMSNVLYAFGVGGGAAYTDATTDGTKCGLQYGSVVFLYDGNTMAVPVSMYYARTNLTGTRRVRSLRPSTDGFSMTKSWHGESKDPGYQTNTNANAISVIDNDTSVSSTNSRTQYRQSNTLHYTGTLGADEYTKTYDGVNWLFYNNNGYSATITMKSGINNGDSVIYVVNYKAILDKITNNKAKLASVTNYKEGGAASLIAAFDQATAFDPNGYSYSSGPASAVSSAGTAISNVVNAFNNASLTADSESYNALRNAIENRKANYKAGNAGGTYTNDSWNELVTAYDAAAAIMTALPSTGYNNPTAAKTAADTLDGVVLFLNDQRVETADLEIAIDNADAAINNKSYFTTDSYTASDIENVVTTAKVAVWSSVDKYKTDEGKLKNPDQNQIIVTNQLAAVKAAVAKLVINPNSVSPSAHNYSLNSAIAYAATFNASEYSNYSNVAAAVTNANAYISSLATVTLDAGTAGSVDNAINEYNNYINAILTAIRELNPAFSNLENGTIANSGTAETTHIDSSHQSGYWTLDFKRNNNQIVFRTTHDAATFDLGGATFSWNTSRNADQHLDSINLADGQSKVGELTSDTDKTAVAMSPNDAQNVYNGSLSASSNGTYKVSNIYVTGKTGNSQFYGKDATGTNVGSLDFKYDEVLATTDGTVPPQGCITGYSDGNNNTRTTTFVSDFTLSLVKTTPKKVSATTIPEIMSCSVNTYFGMVYYYNYSPFLTYYGYSHDRAAYTQSTSVIDISYLIDLIKICQSLNEADYTISSWKALSSALENAKSEMSYSTMTADDILAECVDRYGKLWTAYDALEAPANNKSIKDAISQVKATYDAGSATYSEASWTNFENAYNAAITAVNDKYSDLKVRNFGTSEQPTIDAIATALIDAFNALQSFADFTPVLNAALAIAQGLEADKYTTASLEAIAAELKDSSKFPYLNKTEEERKTVFSDSQSLINTEAQNIAKLTATVAEVDAAALDAAAIEAKAKFKDPDAFVGINEAIQAIKSLNIYSDVEIYNGISVSGVKYANQAELDAEVTNILTSVTPQQYTVTVDGVEVATVDYGTEYTAVSPNGEKVDWYYAYKSNTSENTAKYYTTDYRITFIVKGDTALTTSSAKDTADTVKVTYVNQLNGKTFATDYVTKGSAVTLPAAPARAYYQFDNYTLNGSVVNGTVTADKDITVVANYSRTEADEMYTITVINEDGNFGERTLTAYYNELVTLDFPTGYAWCKVDEADYDDWLNTTPGTEYVLHYGSSYSFYANEDAHISIYTKDQYDAELTGASDGSSMVDLSKQDENGASVVVRDDIIVKEGKFGMIGTFVLPAGCELVESGILFTTNTTADMTLENVGTDGVARMKSSEHTVGDQFVINVRTTNITGNISFAYTAYFTYKDASGVQHTVYSDTVVKNNVNVLK